MQTVTFDYNDFNMTTRRDADCRKHGTARVEADAFGEGFYIVGELGCGKTRKSVHDALREYLGGRELLSHRIYG